MAVVFVDRSHLTCMVRRWIVCWPTCGSVDRSHLTCMVRRWIVCWPTCGSVDRSHLTCMVRRWIVCWPTCGSVDRSHLTCMVRRWIVCWPTCRFLHVLLVLFQFFVMLFLVLATDISGCVWAYMQRDQVRLTAGQTDKEVNRYTDGLRWRFDFSSQ